MKNSIAKIGVGDEHFVSNLLKTFVEGDNFSLAPMFIGFDDIFENFRCQFERFSNGSFNSFPPYNLTQNEDNYVLEIAVAGYDKKDLSVTLDNGILEIKASKDKVEKNDKENKNYLHMGIGRRTFHLKYTLSNDTIIKDAKLENGMLTLTMEKIVPEKKEVQQIEIK